MSRIFISHASANNTAARALAAWLDEQGWNDYFLDIDDDQGIAPGERWMAALAGAVDRCEAVIFLVSPAWRDSKFCFAEFFEAKKLGKRIFGVIVEPIELSQLPAQMTGEWQVCDLTEAPDPIGLSVGASPAVPPIQPRFSPAGLAALARGLRNAGLDASTFVWPPEAEPGRSPYPGLRALEEIDAAVFYGREAAIVRAIDQLRLLRERDVEQLFVVLGASGAGKSSFLRAGLLPRLRRDSAHFVVLPPVRPERAAISGSMGLINSLRATLATAGQTVSPAQLRAELAAGGLAQVLARIGAALQRAGGAQDADGRGRPTLIVPVDQAEELFAADGLKEAQQFLQLLAALPKPMPAGTRVLFVLTMRSDALPLLQGQSALQAMSPVLFSLPAMPVSEFKSVIEGPARRHTASVKPLLISPQLSEQLVIDAHGADALPLLALTLAWLYREYTDAQGTRLGADEYRGLGGVRGVIAMAVARAVERPGSEPAIPADPADQERLLQQVFPHLATVDPDTGDWKRRVALRPLIRRTLPQADAMVSRLVEQRLLVADVRRMSDGAEPVEVVEIAHEALLRQWETLERWLREFGAALSAGEAIRRASIAWQRSQSDAALLVHTAHRLQAAEAVLADPRLAGRFETVDAEYLAACRARDRNELQAREDQLRQIAEQQQARAVLQRRAKWGLWAAAVLVLAAGVGVVMQAREVGLQTAIALTAAAQSAEKDKRFDQSLRLAVLAQQGFWSGTDSSDALGIVVFAAGRASMLRALIQAHAPGLQNREVALSATFSPDGSLVLTAAPDNTARIWNAVTGQPVGEPMLHDAALVSASFSPDGSRVVTATQVMSAHLWNAATSKPIAKLALTFGPPYRIYSLGFDRKGEHIVSVARDIRLWNAHTGQPVGEPIFGGRDSARLVLSPDLKQVVTAPEFGDEAELWNLDTGRRVGVAMAHANAIVSLRFSPDGGRVVTASLDGTAKVWNADTAKQVGLAMRLGDIVDEPRGFEGATRVRGLASREAGAEFSPDGRHVVTFGGDNAARVWDADTGELATPPMLHDALVVSASFNPDGAGRRVLTYSRDHTARLWDARTGQALGKPMVHDVELTSARFSADGSKVVTASSDGSVRVWDALAGLEADGSTLPVPEPTLTPGQVRLKSEFTSSGTVLFTAANAAPLGAWARVRSWLARDYQIEDLCRTRLSGSLGRITESDVRVARILARGRIGENVCDDVPTGLPQ